MSGPEKQGVRIMTRLPDNVDPQDSDAVLEYVEGIRLQAFNACVSPFCADCQRRQVVARVADGVGQNKRDKRNVTIDFVCSSAVDGLSAACEGKSFRYG